LIRVDGTREIGLGHVIRQRLLARALMSEGAEVCAATLADSLGSELLDPILPLVPLSDPADAGELRQAIDAHDPDLVIFDLFPSRPSLLTALGGRALLAFDDTGPALGVAKAAINAIVFHYDEYDVSKAKARLFEGPDFILLDPSFASVSHPAPAAQARRIFLAFGGTDTRDLARLALDALALVAPPLEVRLNLGPSRPPSSGLAAAAQRSPHKVALLPGVSSLADEFQAADLAICAGGLMLYELAAAGLPALAIAGEAHEIRNIDYWAGRGSVASLGSWANFNPGLAAARIEAVIADRKSRQDMADKGKAAVDGRGLERCLGIVRSLLP
jgi:UDP-2,4-diacetamido-2,4,6-trideoxy-beta-L-altropyranose hydrolase